MLFKDIYVPALFGEWLREKHELSESSIFYYVLGIRRFVSTNPDFEDLESYNNFLVEVMIKKRSSNYYSMIKKFIEYYVDEASLRNKLINGLIKQKDRQGIKVVRRHLKEEEIIDVINNFTKFKHRVMALMQMLTGVRAGDIMRLKRSNVVYESYVSPKTKKEVETIKLVIIGKRKKTNVVYLHDPVGQDLLIKYMNSHINHKDYIFIESSSRALETTMSNDFLVEKMNYKWYLEDLKMALQTTGIRKEDFATHDFRRCFARRVWDKYKDINILQNMLNHQDPKVTLTYLKQSGLQNIDHHFDMQINE